LSFFIMIDLSAVVLAVQKECGSFFTTEAHPDPYRYINSAINYILNRRDWQWNRTLWSIVYTTPWQNTTLEFFPSKVYVVKLGNEVQYIYNYEEWFLAEEHTGGVGIFWQTFIADQAWTYNILYAKTLTKVDADNSQIDLPPYYEDVVQWLAMHYAYKDIKDYSTAGSLMAQANAILDSASDRASNVTPRQIINLGSNYTF